jgi:peroxiredoxin Q/BCP
MPKDGQNVPDFQLQSEAAAKISLGDLKGKRALLFFFPKADTPG